MAKGNEALKKIEVIKDLVPTQDAVRLFTALVEAKKDLARSEVDLEKVRSARDIALKQITLKHDLYRNVFDRIFDERRDAIAKHFEIIDKGIATNNQELILGGLQGLATVVSSSPFGDLKALAGLLEGDKAIEL